MHANGAESIESVKQGTRVAMLSLTRLAGIRWICMDFDGGDVEMTSTKCCRPHVASNLDAMLHELGVVQFKGRHTGCLRFESYSTFVMEFLSHSHCKPAVAKQRGNRINCKKSTKPSIITSMP